MCCLLAFRTMWRRARLWLELFASTVGWFLSQLSYYFVLLRFPSETPKLNCNQTIAVSWDEHLENLVSIQHLYCKKRHLFVQKSWGITTSRKQTRSFYVRTEIKTLVTLRMLFAYISPESGQMDALESVYCFLLFWTVYCEFSSMFSTVLIPSFGLLCMALLVLKT